MLDVGTGSGILALAAKCFGADRVIAIDNDPRAIAIAKSNARSNRIHGIRFEIADAKKLNTRGKVDVIVANLFSELLIAAMPKWRARLKSGGILIASGVLRSQERGVVRALREQKIAIEEIRRRGKWIAIVARNQKAG
jgi:ribosomal protein L11 methyltransferase